MPPTIELTEKVLRLGVAVLAGAAVGLNRDLHGKPAGLRTHALVALGAALITLVTIEVLPAGDGSISRTYQGIITGVGFLGAGVILRPSGRSFRVQGLTTAASLWVTACVGAASGSGTHATALLGATLMLLVLVVGGVFERGAERLFGKKKNRAEEGRTDPPSADT